MTVYRKNLLWLIAIGTAARLIFSFTTELGNVEVYYWSWSVKPLLNYYDHPPAVAWMIALTTLGQLAANEFTIRLGAVIASGAATWLIFLCGKTLKDEVTGWYAALLYTCCVYASIAAGMFILPDSPQMVFWLAALLMLLRLIAAGYAPAYSKKYWVLFGLFAGLAIMCKVHGLALWAGFFAYLLFYAPRQFKNSYLYAAAAITLVITSPIIFWNLSHHWATLNFQYKRFTVGGQPIDADHFLLQNFNIIITIAPIPFYLAWRSVMAKLAPHQTVMASQIKLLLFCGIPLIAAMLFVSVFRDVYPHWPGPGYVSLLPIAALYLANRLDADRPVIPSILKWGLAYALFVLVAQTLLINYSAGTSSKDKEGIKTGTGDATVDMIGWKETGRQFLSLYQKDMHSHVIKAPAPIIISAWTPGAAIDFYVARNTWQEIVVTGSLDSLHQYYYSKRHIAALTKGSDAYYLFASNHLDRPMVSFLSDHFETVTNVLTVPVYRRDRLCKMVYVFRLKNYDGRAK